MARNRERVAEGIYKETGPRGTRYLVRWRDAQGKDRTRTFARLKDAREHLGDPWARYCSLPLERGNSRHIGNTPQESVTETHLDGAADASHGGDPSQLLGASMGSVTPVTDVTDSQGWEAEPLGEVVA